MAWYRYGFPKSMTVGERRAKALRAAENLGRKQKLDPVVIDGPLASTWWGRAWNRNLEGYADYSNRLPRGRSYVRHGSVIDLRIEAGTVAALVQGTRPRPYQVEIVIGAVGRAAREALVAACSGKFESSEALLEGRFPEEMDRLLTAEKTGLFPHPRDIRFSCTCPDSAALCKHVAAALFGVGSRLDRDPSLFFRLRKVEMEELLTRAVQEETRKLLRSDSPGESIRIPVDDAGIGALFGIDFGASGESRSSFSDRIAEKRTIRRAIGRPQGGGRKEQRGMADRKRIQSVLHVLDALVADLAALEADLKGLLEP